METYECVCGLKFTLHNWNNKQLLPKCPHCLEDMCESRTVSSIEFDVLNGEFMAVDDFIYINFNNMMEDYGKKDFNNLGMIWTQMFFEFTKITKELLLEATAWGSKDNRGALFNHLKKHVEGRLGDYTIHIGGYKFKDACKNAKPLDMYDDTGDPK